MMNPFTTYPRFIQGFVELHRYNTNIPELKRLREEGRLEDEKALIQKGQKTFIENLSRKIHLTYDIIGEENIPESGPIMVYSNHQSYADIFAMIWLFRNHFQMGYVAKDEWRKAKPLANAIEYTRSIFLIRGSGREALKSLNEAKGILDQGFSLVIFPEGTRSRKHEMGEFKPGAFKFAEKGKVPILPVTLDGGYHLLEETGSYQPTHIKITVHPLVHIEEMSRSEQKKAAAEIEQTIRNALD